MFWNNPFSKKEGLTGPLSRKTLKRFVNSRDYVTGKPSSKKKVGGRITNPFYRNTKQNDINFFDYMTQSLDPELVEKARLIDSGERAKQLVTEQIEQHLERYQNE